MNYISKLAALGAGIGLLSAGFVFGPAVAGGGWGKTAGHGGKGIYRMMKRMDADGNGELTLEEVESSRSQRFAKADGNGDGVVEAAELKARIMVRMERRADRRVQKMMRRFDVNNNGQVSQTEFINPAKRRFSWNDLNDDGKLSGDELPRRRGHRQNKN